MRKTLLYILGIVAMASCSDDMADTSVFLNGKEKTPIAVGVAYDENATSSRGAATRAMDKAFETGDLLLAYLKHVKANSDTGYEDVYVAGSSPEHIAPRLVGFKVTPKTGFLATADNYTDHSKSSTLTTTDGSGNDKGLYWDDFSVGSKGDNTDIRTEGHYLQALYGYCYNGGTPSTELTEATGVLGWTVPYDQTTKDTFKHSDLLWCETQTPPINYDHNDPTGVGHVLNLPYKHAMSEITIVLKADKGFEEVAAPFASTEVIVNNVNKACKTTAPSLTISEASQGTESGKVGKVNAWGGTYDTSTAAKKNMRSFRAIIVPGTKLKEGDVLLNINDVDENNYTLSITDNMLAETAWGKDHTVNNEEGHKFIETKSGYNYKIEVTLKKKEIATVSTLADWDDVLATGEGDIVFEEDYTLWIPGDDPDGAHDVRVDAIDKNKFTLASSFSLFDLKATESNKDNDATRPNDDYSFVTISKFQHDAETNEDSWKNAPEIYWPNANDHYFFRALAEFVETTGSGDEVKNSIKSIGNRESDPVDKGLLVSQGDKDIIWGTTARHYGVDANEDKHPYEAGQAIPPRTGNVPIAFEHILSKITFNLETSTTDENAKVELSGAKIYITDLYTKGTIDLDKGGITVSNMITYNAETGLASAAIKEMYAANETNEELTTRLQEYLVVPQYPLNENAMVYIVLANGARYKIKLTDCINTKTDSQILGWKKGEHYEYTIHLENEKITFRALIKDWVTEEGKGNATLDWD